MSIGLTAFNVNREGDPKVNVLHATGNLGTPGSGDVGVFDFTFPEELGDKYYQIEVSNDSGSVDLEIRSRDTTGFTLKLFKDGEAFDPVDLCIVSVDM